MFHLCLCSAASTKDTVDSLEVLGGKRDSFQIERESPIALLLIRLVFLATTSAVLSALFLSLRRQVARLI